MSGKRPSKKLLLKNKTIAFIYQWTQLSTGKWYIGSRSKKGCHPDDGYLCSSELVFRMIEANPQDWHRDILMFSEDVLFIRAEEKRLLKERDARSNPLSYNKTNSDSDFLGSTAGKICINNGKEEKFIPEEELSVWENLGWSKGRAKSITKRISNTMSNVRADNKDWSSVKGAKNNRAKEYLFTSPNGIEYIVHGELKVFCKTHNLSVATVQRSLKEGWIARRGKNAGWKIKDLDTGRETIRDTNNHGIAISGEHNPYYGGKKKMLNKKSKEETV